VALVVPNATPWSRSSLASTVAHATNTGLDGFTPASPTPSLVPRLYATSSSRITPPPFSQPIPEVSNVSNPAGDAELARGRVLPPRLIARLESKHLPIEAVLSPVACRSV